MSDQIRVVLVRTHGGENLGAVARAMKNFGLSRLILADPGPIDLEQAKRTAVQSFELIEAAPRTSTLKEALDGCAWVVGTTMRYRPGQRHLSPQAVAEEAAKRSRHGDVALVFGEARVGLTNEDLLACHDVSVIETHDALRSLNLAQAVLLYLWEWFQIAGTPAPIPVEPPPAIEADYERLEASLRKHMAHIGFRDPDRPNNGVRELIQTYKRAGLTRHEARLWEAVLSRLGPPHPS